MSRLVQLKTLYHASRASSSALVLASRASIHQPGTLRSLPVRPARTFSSNSIIMKKGGKAARNEAPASHSNSDAASDPLTFDDLNASIQSAVTKLKDDLSKLRPGGRFNPETLEDVKVSLEKTSKSTERLGDLASVVPKGRIVNVIVGDKEHIKPVSAAILASSLNLNPQPDGTNPNQLNINLPPPTAESRKSVVQEALKAADVANNTVKTARGAQQKKLRAAESSKSARPDDIRSASKMMEKLVSDGSAEVKKALDAAKKVLESS